MKAEKIREMSDDELEKKQEDLSEELFRMRLQKATAQLVERLQDAVGDIIEIDIPNRSINVKLSNEELAARRAADT